MSAFIILPVLLLLGGGLDVVRATTAQTQLQTALDSAALSSASLNNSLPVQQIVDEYLEANLSGGGSLKKKPTVTVEAENALNSKNVVLKATGKVNTHFLQVIGITSLPVVASTAATQEVTNIEVALVVDISSSMIGRKMTNLKSAGAVFVDEILNNNTFETTSMNFIPFGGTVNIGDLFDEFVVSKARAVTDPNGSQYGRGRQVSNGDFRFSGGFNCIEHRNTDFNNAVLPKQSRGQVAHFWKWNNFNPWCPEDVSSVLLNTNDRDALKTKIKGMRPSDGTGMNIGAMWGYKTLSPTWTGKLGGDFDDRPAAHDDESLKILVIMTDGDITDQFRPKDPRRLNTHTNQKKNLPTTRSVNPRKANNKNNQVIHNVGHWRDPVTNNTAIGQFKRICEAANRDGIVVYTIGFQIRKNSTADRLLSACASDASKYYFVESLDIESAFKSIASSISALRISG